MTQDTQDQMQHGGANQPGSRAGSPGPSSRAAINVRINTRIADRINREVARIVRSVSHKGSEIGGVLLGTVSEDDESPVTIEDYQLIECDYKQGPLYQIGDAEAERFDQAINASEAGPLKAVGYFRSHTRQGTTLDSDEISFFNSRFGKASGMILLLRPTGAQTTQALIYLREDGTIPDDTPQIEFPFTREELTARGLASGAGATAPAASAAPAAVTSSAETASPMMRRDTQTAPRSFKIVAPPPAKPVAVQEAPKRAQIVPIAAEETSEQESNESASAEADGASIENEAASPLRARIGRCSVTTRIQGPPRRAAGPQRTSPLGTNPRGASR